MAAASDDQPSVTLTWAGDLTFAEQQDVTALVAAATAADGVAPLSEQVLLHLTAPTVVGNEARHLLLRTTNGQLAGYAQLETPPESANADPAPASAEMVVAPTHRRRGYGTAVIAELRRRTPDGRLRIWAHGQQPGARHLAAAAGLRQIRVLWQVRQPLTTEPAEPHWPPGVTVRTFVPGQDEERWLACNARAFANHPEQGSWTRADLDLRERETWFDPAGFFLAERDEPGAALLGFHWTKVHPANAQDGPHGEIYVIGIDPDAQGGGLGRALLLRGMRHLYDEGLRTAMLYVDEDNVPAMTLYQRMGFVRVRADVRYETE